MQGGHGAGQAREEWPQGQSTGARQPEGVRAGRPQDAPPQTLWPCPLNPKKHGTQALGVAGALSLGSGRAGHTQGQQRK